MSSEEELTVNMKEWSVFAEEQVVQFGLSDCSRHKTSCSAKGCSSLHSSQRWASCLHRWWSFLWRLNSQQPRHPPGGKPQHKQGSTLHMLAELFCWKAGAAQQAQGKASREVYTHWLSQKKLAGHHCWKLKPTPNLNQTTGRDLSMLHLQYVDDIELCNFIFVRYLETGWKARRECQRFCYYEKPSKDKQMLMLAKASTSKAFFNSSMK